MNTAWKQKNMVTRWCAFNFVGAGGIVVQLTVLHFLIHHLRLHYLPATALAVEAAVLHNFIWHERWTWKDRSDLANRSAKKSLAPILQENCKLRLFEFSGVPKDLPTSPSRSVSCVTACLRRLATGLLEISGLNSHGVWRRLLLFHLANGVLSIAGNLLLMRFFVGTAAWSYLSANFVTIAAVSLLNFWAGDKIVFRNHASVPKEETKV